MATEHEMIEKLMAKMRPAKVVQTAAPETAIDDPMPETTAQISYGNYDVAF